MASAISPSTAEENEFCTICTNKYNRKRSSFCQCKHCSIPLCFDCMKQHHDELLQNVERMSHQYNELRELVRNKQTMINEDITKCTGDVNRYFDRYINQLRATQKKIVKEMENAKQQAQNHVQKIDADLQTIGNSIQGLVKDGAVQTTKMKKVTSDLEQIEQQLNTYQLIRTENLIDKQPEFTIRFDYPSTEMKATDSTGDSMQSKCQTKPSPLPLTTNTSNLSSPSTTAAENLLYWPLSDCFYQDEDEDDLFWYLNTDCDSDIEHDHINTTYNVDRMAGDDENVLYTSYVADGWDIIAYCIMDATHHKADEYRNWKQSRIEDMIWWGYNRKFICATKTGIYTVDQTQKKFKISNVLLGDWSYIRVATHINELFLWMHSLTSGFHGIEVFCSNLHSIRKIDFIANRIGSFIYNSNSFCVTTDYIASICKRTQRNREVFQVTFCDWNMYKLNSIPLGQCEGEITIRTNGDDEFYITTGTRRFYVLDQTIDTKQSVQLKNKANVVAFLEDLRVAVDNPFNTIKIINY